MSYFVLNNFPTEKPRGTAKPRELNPDRVRNRSELIAIEAEAIANDNAKGDFIHKKLSPNEQQNTRMHQPTLAARNASHDIFGPPIISPRPSRRHQPLSDEVVRTIYPQPDARKTDAQIQMSVAPTMVDKMVADDHPIPIKKEVSDRHQLRQVPIQEFQNSTLPGFRGMGNHSGPQRNQGLATKVTDFSDYVPDLPNRSKPLSPRVKAADVYNPINGQKNPYYGKH